MNIIKTHTKPSVKDLWETPTWFVRQLQHDFHITFVLDPCCTVDNKKGWYHFDENDDGLSKSWCAHTVTRMMEDGNAALNATAFVNPPFSQLNDWIEKSIETARKGMPVALLHPDTRDTKWYQKIEKHCFMQLLPTSRLNYINPESRKDDGRVNFHSCVSLFNALPTTGDPKIIRFELSK